MFTVANYDLLPCLHSPLCCVYSTLCCIHLGKIECIMLDSTICLKSGVVWDNKVSLCWLQSIIASLIFGKCCWHEYTTALSGYIFYILSQHRWTQDLACNTPIPITRIPVSCTQSHIKGAVLINFPALPKLTLWLCNMYCILKLGAVTETSSR